MSIKSIVFGAALFLVLGLYTHPVRADFTSPSVSEEDTLDTAAAMRDMKALFELPSGVEFPLKSPALFEKIEKEPFSKNLSEVAIQEKLGKVLKDQEIMDLMTLPVVSKELTEEYDAFILAKRLQFTPGMVPTSKDVSWAEKVKEFLKKGKFFPDPYNEMVFYW